MRARWLSPDFVVPTRLSTADFVLRPLVIGDVVKDYDAVMTSREHLRGAFGPDSHWPEATLTLEQDLVDLGWHQKEFQMGSSFSYTVVNPEDTMTLGCVYIFPCTRRGFDAEVYYWVRASHAASGMDQALGNSLRQWLAQEWPFKKIAFPGRDIAWSDWSHTV